MDIKLASAPVSWGVILKDTPGVPPYKKVLNEIKKAGYTGTELGPIGYLPLDAGQLRDELAERDLTLISAYVPVNFIDPQARKEEYDEGWTVARYLNEMGCEWIVLSDALFAVENRNQRAGRIRPEDGLDEAGWDVFAKNVEDFARKVYEELGLKSVFHPHVGAYVETPQEIDALLTRTDSDLVGLCLDTAHVMYGGGDPIAVCKRWSERMRYLHLKECDGAKLEEVRANEWDYFKGVEIGVFPELGQGSVDFAKLLAVLEKADFSGWAIVEQDVLPESGADPLASAQRNLAYLSKLGYATNQ
jgi:inosose dehydratase